MPAIIGHIQANPQFQGFDDDGVQLAAGKLYSFLAGTSTPHVLYTDAALTAAHPNPIILDGDGRATVYLDAVNYKLRLDDTNDVVMSGWPIDNVQDIAQIQFGQLGQTQASGAIGVVTNYTVLQTDNMVTVDTAAGALQVTLHAASVLRLPLCIKNLGVNLLTVARQAGDTIDGVAANYVIPVGASPDFPSLYLVPDGTSDWLILASHKA